MKSGYTAPLVGEFKVNGLSDLLKTLKSLPEEIDREKLVQKAMYQAAIIPRDEAQRLVPKKTGRLEMFIGRGTRRSKKTGEIIVAVGLVKLHSLGKKSGLSSDAGYGMWVEFGHMAHGTYVPAEPFLRPAFDRTKERFAIATAKELKPGIDRAVSKLSRVK